MNNNNSDNPPPLPPSPPPPSPPLPPPPSPPPLLTNTPHPCIPTSSRAESFDEGSRSLVLGHIGGGSDGENPKKKKRSKLTRITTEVGSSSSSPNSNNIVHPKPKPTAKKPEPNAPNITRPCTECGKQFWSWKALFGHMRCHPERQWRGINPPPNLRKPVPALDQGVVGEVRSMNNISDEDQEVVTSLLMLANGLVSRDLNQPFRFNIGGGGSPEGLDYTTGQAVQDQPLGGLGFGDGAMLMGSSSSSYRFECSSCKKVFGSHQALGGHRASHKNVKGCFAIARNDDEPNCSNIIDLNLVPAGSGDGNNGERDGKMVMDIGHKCGICFRVFSSGQALGGHMRCHWEKDEHEPLLIQQGQGLLLGPTSTSRIGGVFLDLNLPPPSSETHHGDENSSSSSSSSTSTSSSSKVLGLDLRLGFP